jgi:phage terminase large subunit-like protein
LEDVEGALWTYAQIDADRVRPAEREYKRIVIGVDPKASREADSETGIVVIGLGMDNQGYVLADYSLNGTPEEWARKVATAYLLHNADRIVVEKNMGGDMVTSVLRAANVKLPLRMVVASRGKQTRAEPVAALYEQHRIHHVGVLPGLEDQMCSWVPGESDSPDRCDALVWAVTDLMLNFSASSMLDINFNALPSLL